MKLDNAEILAGSAQCQGDVHLSLQDVTDCSIQRHCEVIGDRGTFPPGEEETGVCGWRLGRQVGG